MYLGNGSLTRAAAWEDRTRTAGGGAVETMASLRGAKDSKISAPNKSRGARSGAVRGLSCLCDAPCPMQPRLPWGGRSTVPEGLHAFTLHSPPPLPLHLLHLYAYISIALDRLLGMPCRDRRHAFISATTAKARSLHMPTSAKPLLRVS